MIGITLAVSRSIFKSGDSEMIYTTNHKASTYNIFSHALGLSRESAGTRGCRQPGLLEVISQW